jgi:Aspartyl protease/PDZ domain
MKALTVILLFGIAALAQSVSPKAEPPTVVAVIPFELIADHLYVQATLNDSFLLSAMIDSGSPDSVFDNSLAIKLGLPSSGTMLMPGFGNDTITPGQKVEINSLSLYGARLNKVAADSVSLGSFSQLIGHETDVVIGSSDLFTKYVVELNYAKRELRLYDPNTYIEPREGCQLPLLVDLYPVIRVQLVDSDEKLIDGAFILDTGSNYLLVTKLFGDAHPSLSLDGKTIEAAPRKFLSGLTPFRAGRIRAITLGDCVVEQPVAAFLQEGVSLGAAKQKFSGTIGINVLRNFTTIFDYRHRTVTFIRSNTTAVVPQYDMTGIHVLASDPSFHKFTVDFVLSESPAARCGIRVGDTIDSANHIPVSQLTVNDLYEMFKRQGSLRLTISRNGVRLKKKLKLKLLI